VVEYTYSNDSNARESSLSVSPWVGDTLFYFVSRTTRHLHEDVHQSAMPAFFLSGRLKNGEPAQEDPANAMIVVSVFELMK